MTTGIMRKNLVKFGRVVFDASGQTDRRTYYNTLHPSRGEVLRHIGQDA